MGNVTQGDRGDRPNARSAGTQQRLKFRGGGLATLGAQRVFWQTDHLNERSQRAIERLGAQREGVLRKHRIRPDGTIRDTVQYSLTDDEWPAARAKLEQRLQLDISR